jgi:hypothetical protein
MFDLEGHKLTPAQCRPWRYGGCGWEITLANRKMEVFIVFLLGKPWENMGKDRKR